jgi:hypothetical protein
MSKFDQPMPEAKEEPIFEMTKIIEAPKNK